jgi:mono/diheme cytochrome c family protein
MRPRFLFIFVLLLGFYPSISSAQDAADFFQRNCTSCHTIGGGRLTGPDLKDVTKQKDREWLEQFIQGPKAVIDSGDAFAVQLQQDARGVIMPTVPGLTPPMAKLLLDMIEAESGPPISRFAGKSVSDRPFSSTDIATGIAIFRGDQRLSQGGPACISCHTIGALDGLGGGRLGPDLTQVYGRLGGRKAVGAWLAAPGTATMQSVFRRHTLQSEEILPLLAVFENVSQSSQPADTGSQANFVLAGFAGLCGALALMGWVWRDRFRSVRGALIRMTRGEE